MSKFDSHLAKARALAAIIATDSGATEGERENARAALARHLERYGLRAEDLDASKRREQSMLLTVWQAKGDPKPCRDKRFVRLAVHCLSVVLDDITVKITSELDRFTPWKGGCMRVFASVTDAEYEEWQACFAHYAPAFAATLDALKKQAAAANKAVKLAAQGFCARHDIFPASHLVDADSPKSKASPAEIAAIIAAAHASQGTRWERPAGALAPETLALPVSA